MCDSSSFAVDLLNELARAFMAAADTRSQVPWDILHAGTSHNWQNQF